MFLFTFSETRSHVVQPGLKLTMGTKDNAELLSLPFSGGSSWVPPHPVSVLLGTSGRAVCPAQSFVFKVIRVYKFSSECVFSGVCCNLLLTLSLHDPSVPMVAPSLQPGTQHC